MAEFDEILSQLGVLRGTVEEGFKGSHRRHDIANGRLAKLEGRVEDLEKGEIKLSGQIETNTEHVKHVDGVRDKWMDRGINFVLYIVAFLAMVVLTKLNIINL